MKNTIKTRTVQFSYGRRASVIFCRDSGSLSRFEVLVESPGGKLLCRFSGTPLELSRALPSIRYAVRTATTMGALRSYLDVLRDGFWVWQRKSATQS